MQFVKYGANKRNFSVLQNLDEKKLNNRSGVNNRVFLTD